LIQRAEPHLVRAELLDDPLGVRQGVAAQVDPFEEQTLKPADHMSVSRVKTGPGAFKLWQGIGTVVVGRKLLRIEVTWD
jgi:hypothetical protein